MNEGQPLVQEEFVDAVKSQLSASNGAQVINRMFTVDLSNSAAYQGGFEIQQNDNGCCYISKDLSRRKVRHSNADLEEGWDNSFGTFESSLGGKPKERSFGMPSVVVGQNRSTQSRNS